MSGDVQSGRALDYDVLATRIVALLLLFELVSVFFLWTFNPVGSGAEATFVLILATDLISFALISYVYRALKTAGMFGRLPVVGGCAFIALLLLLSFLA